MKIKHVILWLAASHACALGAAAHQTTTQLRNTLEGTWEVFILPPARNLEGKLNFQPSQSLGMHLQFHDGAFSHDKDFLFLPDQCEKPTYAIRENRIPADSIPPEGSLNFSLRPEAADGLGPLRADRETLVHLYCGGKLLTGLDISHGGFLAIYWNTGFFYLRKVVT